MAGFARGPQSASGDDLSARIGVEDLSVWVIETHNPPTPVVPGRPGTERYRWSRWSGRSEWSRGARLAVPNRNANPLNIKVGQITRRYVESGQATISEVAPLDGGRFLKFESPEAGFRAAVELLTSTSYRHLDLDRALRRWSNNGFGAEILAGTQLHAGIRIDDLRRDEFTQLLRAMAAAEGYRSAVIAGEIATALRP